MPRDYKHTAKKKKKKRTRKQPRTAGWPRIGIAAAAGALLAGTGVYLYRDSSAPSAETPGAGKAVHERPAPEPAPERERSQGPGENAGKAPRFEFYTLLPEIEVEITEEDLGAALKALPEKEHKGPYILQAGSFRHFEEADNLKARLALIGVEASIQTVTINDQATWYRVRIGPYDTLRDLKPVRSRLKRNDIEFMLMSVKGEGEG